MENETLHTEQIEKSFFEGFRTENQTWNTKNAWCLGRLSQLVYENKEEIERQLNILDKDTVKQFDFFTTAHDTQFFGISTDTDVIITFRGTQTNSVDNVIKDWTTNIKIGQIGFEQYGAGRVHKGFYDAFEGSWDTVRDFLAKSSTEHKKHVWLTGHSLGGAIATLTFAALVNQDRVKESGNFDIGGLCTFGQPKVGNAEFRNQFDNYLDRMIRVENCNDPVAILPVVISPKLRYKHVGLPKTIDINGVVRPVKPEGVYKWERRFDIIKYMYKIALTGIFSKSKLPKALAAYIDHHDIGKYIKCCEDNENEMIPNTKTPKP